MNNFNKTKYHVILAINISSRPYKYIKPQWINSSPAEKRLECHILAEKRVDPTHISVSHHKRHPLKTHLQRKASQARPEIASFKNPKQRENISNRISSANQQTDFRFHNHNKFHVITWLRNSLHPDTDKQSLGLFWQQCKAKVRSFSLIILRFWR